ncbi:Protein of unknown function [Nocardia farcinica]|uniref:Protein of uncharacterized function (DUF2848) n=1 Tax=Nocardia farcinica TaxID=37329 RepID=A0A0H5NEL4_NOCFR|nr:DUF2848 domain-containing protein [Nocardia farcinica]AXK88892.1 DUF2848 domain-containing protein [Nocardia farcinica]MBF6360197.1 DUF2848 domain-containing protein [Nocardia farcinica]PFX03975.1 hypothetical protein CJ469_01849 [Nocardia farcinica]PFX10133.1 hypothetical protein CJ468_00980 [Nocardia farcinica]CRY73749.1 Protein of uncharacterised function (DUF2848) [Nocardia farcinica]
MSSLIFELPDGRQRTVPVRTLLNAGYAGRSQADVAAHIAELAELGVPGPSRTPCFFPLAPYLAMQIDEVPVQHERTSGEAEWALVVAGDEPGDLLITAACDHTDRLLEQHGVGWSKQAAPDVLARTAWHLDDVADHIDELTLTGSVLVDGEPTVIQQGTLAELLTPQYWIEDLRSRGLFEPGTVLMSGTIPMRPEVDQFSAGWSVELGDPRTGRSIALSYAVRPTPPPLA